MFLTVAGARPSILVRHGFNYDHGGAFKPEDLAAARAYYKYLNANPT